MMNKLHGIIFAYLSNPDLRELTQHQHLLHPLWRPVPGD